MAHKYPKHFLIINLIFVILAAAIISIFEVAGPENIVILFVFSGFVTSYFIKESTLWGYTKQALVSSSIFSVLSIAAFGIYIYFTEGAIWSDHSIFDLITIFIIFFAFLSFFNLVGAVIGVIPKAITERMTIAKKAD